MVMKSKLCKTQPIKRIYKKLLHTNWIENIAELKSHSNYTDEHKKMNSSPLLSRGSIFSIAYSFLLFRVCLKFVLVFLASRPSLSAIQFHINTLYTRKSRGPRTVPCVTSDVGVFRVGDPHVACPPESWQSTCLDGLSPHNGLASPAVVGARLYRRPYSEIKQHSVDLLPIIESLHMVLYSQDQLGFTRTTISEAMLCITKHMIIKMFDHVAVHSVFKYLPAY